MLPVFRILIFLQKKYSNRCNIFECHSVFHAECASKISLISKLTVMRKYFLIMLFSVQMAWAGNVNSIINEFKDVSKAEYVSVPWILMKIGHMFMDDDESKDIAARINGVRVLDLADCSPKIKARFNKRISSLSNDGYETLVRAKDEDGSVQILVKEKKDIIKELLIICGGDEDCALIQLRGNIRQEDIDELVKEETGKRNGRK